MRSVKEALLRSICDIDSIFLTLEKRRTLSMALASIGVLFEGQLMAENIGRPKAILCSEKLEIHNGGATTYIYAKELVEDREIDKEYDRLIAICVFEWGFWPNVISTKPQSIGISFMKKRWCSTRD